MNEGETSTRLGLIGAPAEAEAIIIDRDLHLIRMTGARYHAAHISTRAAIESIRRAKAEGLPVTADTAPPYFMLNEMAVSTYDTAFKLSPPLRSEDDRQAVIAALADGTIDAITSRANMTMVLPSTSSCIIVFLFYRKALTTTTMIFCTRIMVDHLL